MKKYFSYGGMPLACLFFFLLATECMAQSGQKWAVDGNTTATGDFLGTLTNEPLIFKTNNQLRLRIKANGEMIFKNLDNQGNGLFSFDNDGKLIPFAFSGDANQVLTGAGVFTHINGLSGWKFNGNDMFNINLGNVGIGTPFPGEKLHVEGNALVNGYILTKGISIIGTAQGSMIASDTMQTNIMMMDTLSKIEGETRIVGSASVSQKLGVGTKYPTEALEIVGNSKISGNSSISGTLSGNIINANDLLLPGIEKQKILTTNLLGKVEVMSTEALHALMYTPGTLVKNCLTGTETMAWVANGSSLYADMPACAKVGVGTASPQYTLDVIGTAHVSGSLRVGNNSLLLETLVSPQGTSNNISTTLTGGALSLQSIPGNNQHTIINGNNKGYVGIGQLEPDAKLHVDIDDAGKYAAVIRNGAANGYGLQIRTGTSGQGGTGLLVMDDNGNELFKINNGNGFCYARDIIVQASPFPDFVFTDSYSLMSISEKEKYIQENKHLPYMETAKQVENNGAQIGKTLTGILQNTEELTLYIIELNKKMAALQQQNEVLRKQVEEFSKQK